MHTANPQPHQPSHTAREPPPAQQHPAAIREVDDPDIDAALDAIVADAPPLPYQVRARLAWLLRGQATGTDRAA
jgi:hypothetical protein